MSPSAQETKQADDIQELIRSIAEERRSGKEKEQRERWTRYVSLMVVALAVATGIGSLKAGGFSSKAMLFQARATDEWAYYQAKSIKQRIAEMEARGSNGPAAAIAAADVVRYKNDQKISQEKAQGFEQQRDIFLRPGPKVGLGITFLQISIALASVCLLTKRRALWGASGVVGAIGIGYLIYGLYLI
jgi:hypothetical protein